MCNCTLISMCPECIRRAVANISDDYEGYDEWLETLEANNEYDEQNEAHK